MKEDSLPLILLAVVALGGGSASGDHEDKDPAAAKAEVLRSFSARGFPAEEAEAAIRLESGWKPHIIGKNIVTGEDAAVGLIQFTRQTLRGLGWTGTLADFARLSVGEQAPWIGRYIARSVRAGHKWSAPGDTYVLLAGNEFVGAPDEAVMYRVGTMPWTANPSLRTDWDPKHPTSGGDITAGSVRGALLRAMGAIIPPPATPGYAQPGQHLEPAT